MNKIFASLLFIATIGLLSACQDPAPEPAEQPPAPIANAVNAAEPSMEDDNTESVWATCPEQRPEMCTQIYQPVCGIMDTGVRCVTTPCPSSIQKTFGNACTACAETRVSQFRDGECETQDENAN